MNHELDESKSSICESEFEVLEMFEGTRPFERGAWVNACTEFLQGDGYITRSIQPKLTKKALEALDKRRNL